MLPGEMGTAWGVRDEVAAWGNGGQQRCDSRALNAKPRSPKNMRKPGPVLFLPPPPRHPSPPPPPQETLALFPPFVASGRLTAALPPPPSQLTRATVFPSFDPGRSSWRPSFCASKCHPHWVGHPVLGFQPSGVWEPNKEQDDRAASIVRQDPEQLSCAVFPSSVHTGHARDPCCSSPAPAGSRMAPWCYCLLLTLLVPELLGGRGAGEEGTQG